jgi:hypothetical protein
MRLAEYVAHTTDVDGMLDRMSTKQFDEWCAKDAVEPIGLESVRAILAQMAMIVANFAGVKMTAADFMPWVKTDKEISPDSLKPLA